MIFKFEKVLQKICDFFSHKTINVETTIQIYNYETYNSQIANNFNYYV